MKLVKKTPHWVDNSYCLYNNECKLSREEIDCYYNRNFNKFDKNYIITGFTSSPASSFYRTLVEKITSFLYSKFPEYSTENPDVEVLLDENKHILEQFFYKAVFEYVLYGEVFVNYAYETEFLEINYDRNIVYMDYIETQGKLQGVDVTCYFKDNLEYLKKGDDLFLISSTSNRYYMNLYDNMPFIQYVYSYFRGLEDATSKNLQSVDAIRNILTLPQQFHKDVIKAYKEKFSDLLLLTQPNGINAGQITNGWVNNTPLATTQEILTNSIQWFRNEIVEVLGLTDIFNKIVKDNPSETRVSAENRVNLSTLTWEMKQRKVNNFVLFCLKDFILRRLGINDETLEVNALNMVQKEQKQQEEAQTLTTIMNLIKESRQATGSTSQLIYYVIAEMSTKAGFSNELKAKIDNIIKENEDIKKQQAENPPTDWNALLIQSQIELNKNKALEVSSESWLNSSKLNTEEVNRQKTMADIQQNQEELQIEKEDADQQLLDAKRRAEELNSQIQLD